MNFDISQLTPGLAIVVLVFLALVDLALGFLLSLKLHQTTVQRLPNWLYTSVLQYVVPAAVLWLSSDQSQHGTFMSTTFVVSTYTAAVTCAPKLAQDVVRKFLALVVTTPATPTVVPSKT